ncbi:uncharacterized protein J8A68_004213 [[Candida] subhashii]|uniref:Polyprenal reductase n=1 Tax=[Candida] subhashii TaxID=561895 RepID=A0A8J5QHV4_9ASCO|nr:uncharacterized protein J8A68_004213 [[Candida] subhashii]KAG7662319.1 hypothetical protein J8A68_004213 [[Candida] subhashii]
MVESYPIQLIPSLGYIFLTIGIFTIKYLKSLNSFLLYGKTATKTTLETYSSSSSSTVRYISNHLTVPKAWFTHFYINAFGLSTALYLLQFTGKQQDITTGDQIAYKNMLIIQRLLWIQTGRRLLECLFLSKFSKTARMNIAHYFIGYAHYILVSLACYIGLTTYYTSDTQKVPLTLADYCLIIWFIVASIQQFLNHYHLSTLIKYTVPKFKLVSSPHYFNEIQIYIIFFILSVKNGWSLTSLNYLCCLIYVMVSLSISSLETYKYYQLKFKEEFKLKWSIFPGVL